LQGSKPHDPLRALYSGKHKGTQPHGPKRLILGLSCEPVKGSDEFYRFYCELRPGSVERRVVDSGLDELKASATAGKKTHRRQWPPYCVRKYRVTNLWKLDLSRGARMIYSVE